MNNNKDSKLYDLEERTFCFAKNVREFVSKLPKTLCNFQDIPQLVRSSGSIGANYIEANESLSKKDFIMRIKISRKEAKETQYWLKLINLQQLPEFEKKRLTLLKESIELVMIFSSIIKKSQ